MSERTRHGGEDELPDVRDGLSRLERVILWQLDLARRELGRASVPTALLYGRVVEHVDVSVERFQAALARLVGHGNA
jgi:hypothetical protein